jgi:hypothetical protein
VTPLLSDEHFPVDRSLGFDEELPKKAGEGRDAEVDFHGRKRSNETHASVTDLDARLCRKGERKEAKLCYIGHALMENRNSFDRCCHSLNAWGDLIRDAKTFTALLLTTIKLEPVQ